ncbi:aklaviketone reductase [Stenotrophomonas maltophilia]|jgi:NAD(P)-dependent dehydrogenase (short-subunit alcohol dehydrogenase family)|uniref:Aklaviketone reductase n=1 Tax=Stenotrophomonas maltophilia TaxID=40324 RepID=A0A246HRL5_STEMA|nr:SDR family oxidoreductase [Stenotrophomonas maltophilia]OWQ57092.1 aklaviketone reductase [Stenotrophomonas maltophilia]
MNGTLAPEVLVLGGTGSVGQGIVAALLEAGSPVLVVGRDPGRLAALQEQFADEPGLEVLLGSLGDDGSARTVAERIGGRPRALAAVVDAMGGPYNRGRVTDRSGDALLQALQADVMPHVHAGRHLLPLVRGGAQARRYVLVGGPAGFKPWAGHGESSITMSATRMYAQVLHQEAQALGVRAQMLEVCDPVCTPANAAKACIEWPSALLVGRRVVSLLDNCTDNRAIVRCDARDAELPRGLLHLDRPPPMSRNTAGTA